MVGFLWHAFLKSHYQLLNILQALNSLGDSLQEKLV